MDNGKKKKLTSAVFKYFFIPIVIVTLLVFSSIFYRERLILKNKVKNLYRKKYTELITLYLSSSLKHIENTAKDWGVWNDSYYFVKNKNKEFIQDNFPGNTLKNLDINYMLFFNKKKMVFGVKNKDIPLNKNPLGFIPKQANIGFIKLKNNVYFYASSKILPSNGKGKPDGILVILKKVSIEKLKKDIDSIKIGNIPKRYTMFHKNGLEFGSFLENYKHYLVLFDINKKPVASLVFSLQPKILHYIYKFVTLNIFGLSLLFIFISGGLLYLGISRYFIKKVTKLSKKIESIPSDLNITIKDTEKEFEPILKTILKLVERIKESEYMFEKIADIIPAGIIICGDKILYANRYAKEVIKEDIVGKDIKDVLQDRDKEIFSENIKRRRKGEQFTTSHILKLKTPFPLIVYAVSTGIKYKGENYSLSTFVDITEIINLKEKYQKIVENLPYGVFHKEIEIENGKIKHEINLYISPDIKKITMYEEEEISTIDKWEQYIVSDKTDKIEKLIVYGKSEDEYRIKKKDGKIIWIKDITVVLNKKDNKYEILNIIEEITKRKKISMFYQTLYRINAIKVKAESENELLSSICTCLAVTCAFKVVWMGKVYDNNKVKLLFEHGDKSIINNIWSPIYDKNTKPIFEFKGDQYSNYSATLSINIDNKPEYTLNVYSEIFSIFDKEFLNLLKQLANDIGDSIKRIRYRKALMYELYHDKLTGLKNMTSLLENINKLESCSLIYLRINNLPTLNQIYGIEFSNKIIKKVGNLISKIIGNVGEVYKVPGNRFAILINDTLTKKELTNISKKIISQIAEINIEDNRIPIETNIGISIYPDLVNTKKDILSSAESALIRARQTGKLEFYSLDIKKNIEKHFRIGNYLKKAIKENTFFFYYQPILDIKNNKITKCEALIRLKDENGALINPEQFISIAEQMNLIEEITRLVVENVLTQTKNIPHIDVALNVSAKDIDNKNLLTLIKKKMEETGRKNLSIEITERDIVENISKASDFIEELRKLNIKIEIDDFGVKYSSLNRLIEINFDVIKIDKTLIDMIGNKKADRVIIYIIELAHSMNAKVQAEGVEKEKQFKFLKENGCDFIQGYYISKPLEFDNFLKFIDNLGKNNFG